jgi:hypothetical protein
MRHELGTRKVFRQSARVGVVLLLALQPLQADESLNAELQACRRISDVQSRAQCYDDVVDRRQANATIPSPEESAPADGETRGDSTYVQLNDEIGRETLREDEAEQPREIIRGRVVRCRTDSLNDTYFYFDNGQVWKQTSDSRVKPEDCEFEVTITRDFFGYKMQRVGERRRIRISRVQ